MVDEALAAFARVHEAFISATEDEWANLDLTVTQLRALLTIDGASRISVGISVGGLAQRLGARLSSTSILVDRLVRAGLVARAEDAKDRRRVLLVPTEEGSNLVVRLRQGRVELRQWLLALSPDTLNALTVGLRALAEVASGSVTFSYLESPGAARMPVDERA